MFRKTFRVKNAHSCDWKNVAKAIRAWRQLVNDMLCFILKYGGKDESNR